MSCTRRGVKTEHLVRVTQTHTFSRLAIINAHALAQNLTVKDMWIVCLRALIKSHSFVSCFVVHCLSHGSHLLLYTTSVRQKPCSTLQGGLILGRLAEQSPLTFMCRQRNFDDSVNNWTCRDSNVFGTFWIMGVCHGITNGSIHDLCRWTGFLECPPSSAPY